MPPKRVPLENRTAQETPKTPANDQRAPAKSSALWPEEAARQEVVGLEVTQIMPNPRQPRTIFDQTKLEELADSIREHGVIQPIIVHPISLTKWEGHARRYQLIAGERRWRASMLAGRDTIPALVRQGAGDHGTLIELALIENLQRADLHPLEEALAFGTMRDQLGYSIRRIAERVGRSKGYVENRLKLLDLAPDLEQLVSERPDTLMHVGELGKVADPAMRAQLIEAVRGGLSYAETQARVREILAPPATEHASEVSLRKDSDRRDQDSDHGSSSTAAVSLRKDSDRRDQDSDHGNSHPSQAPEQPAGVGKEIQQREEHVRHQDDERAASQSDTSATPQAVRASDDVTMLSHDRDGDGDDQAITLSTEERTSLAQLSGKLEMWINQPERLTTDDWRLLAPILQRLHDLSERVEQ